MPELFQDQQPATRFIFRGRPQTFGPAGDAFGVALPETGRAATAKGRSALWLGPDEWLLLAPAGEAAAIETTFRQTLAGQPYSLVEISERQVGITLSGPLATTLLATGCPLDFDEMPVGMCTRTVFSKAEIVLWRQDKELFHLEVWRSFADYVRLLLGEAGREFAA